MAVDKNLPALLDEKAYTIRVKFQHMAEGAQVAAPPRKVSTDQSPSMFMDEPTPLANCHTYITNIPGILPGMLVVVPVAAQDPRDWTKDSLGEIFPNRANVAIVVGVDTEVMIEPDSEIKYAWVAAVVDLTDYNKTIERNRELDKKYATAYKHNARRQFASHILAQLPSEERESIQKLLGN